ncbi:LamG-like jellyroll fold domain-containing protein [Fluviicola taffensis]|uniref:Secretion system C-terminal sorting domain-containing protein n=1 Tax=Fluviicola taffensis (strain DSM 16823 / NCIMB 13979 / RW262) TaxID=755732 RepID=F2I941_FLUTR|nr:LamG-like jellyroll fold domain-containing protein [Fluviicola taffensis]AEA42988.1 hypothetical protein Fluta_0987 [Fluviicola taffensis DSM 16823]
MKRKLYLLSAIVLTSVSSTFAQYPTNGLIGYYPFNANIEDASSNNIDMTSPTAPGYFSDRFNAPNSCYESSSGARIPNVQNSANISFSLWVHPLNINDYYPAIFSRALYLFNGSSNIGKVGNYLLYLEPSTLTNQFGVWMECHQGIGGPNSTTYEYFGYPQAIDVAEWSHIAVTIQGTDAKMYINGTLTASMTLATSMVAVTANDPNTGVDQINDLVLGKSKQIEVNSGSYSDYLNFSGFIDDIFIYDRALSAAEVTTLYTLPQNPTPVGTASINEQTANLVNVYPNPTADFMQVELTAENESAYSIYSADNREVMNGTLSTGNNSIDVQTLAARTYFLKTTINGSVVTKKITKQ